MTYYIIRNNVPPLCSARHLHRAFLIVCSTYIKSLSSSLPDSQSQIRRSISTLCHTEMKQLPPYESCMKYKVQNEPIYITHQLHIMIVGVHVYNVLDRTISRISLQCSCIRSPHWQALSASSLPCNSTAPCLELIWSRCNRIQLNLTGLHSQISPLL